VKVYYVSVVLNGKA